MHEPDALRELYRHGYGRLVGALTLATGHREDAEEIAQEAFTRLIVNWSRVSRFDNPEAWVRRVAFRLLVDRRRRAMRTAAPPSPDTMVATDADEAIDIARAVAMLPLHQRQVVLLHYLYDLRVEDVAQLLGVRSGTVKSRLARARSTLAQILSEEVVHGA